MWGRGCLLVKYHNKEHLKGRTKWKIFTHGDNVSEQSSLKTGFNLSSAPLNGV